MFADITYCRVCVSCSVMSDSLQPHGLVMCQVPPLSTGFFRQGYWSGLPLPSPGESSRPRNQTRVSCTAGIFFIVWEIEKQRHRHGPNCPCPTFIWESHSSPMCCYLKKDDFGRWSGLQQVIRMRPPPHEISVLIRRDNRELTLSLHLSFHHMRTQQEGSQRKPARAFPLSLSVMAKLPHIN